MSLSIGNNLTALSAQSSLRSADSQLSVVANQLSSGNRIVTPNIDASGLAIGTSLKTNASTLQSALTGANNATSLLQEAAGGLSNIGSILQRMQSLATQSNSGTNDNNARSFLNQEYQALISQVDQIASGTTFNTTNLLNGSLAGSVAIGTNTNNSAAAPAFTQKTVFTVAGATAPTDGQTITIGGATITFTTDSTQTNKVLVGANQTVTAGNLADFLNTTPNAGYAGFTFTNAAGVLTAVFSGGLTNANNSAITLTSADVTYVSGTAATATIATADGDNGLSINRTTATGQVNGTDLLPLTQGGVNATQIKNNAAFIGNLFGTTSAGGGGVQVSATYTAANTVTLAFTVGNYTYSGSATTTGGGTITLAGLDSNGNSGGTITLNQSATGFSVADQSDANTYAQRIENALGGVTFTQNRNVSSFVGGGNILTNGVVTGSLQNSIFDLSASNFANANVSNVSVAAPGVGQNDATIQVTINGQIYQSQTGIGNTIAAGSKINLVNQSNPSQVASLTIGATKIQITSAAQAASFQSALQTAFGLGTGGTGLVFQVGVNASQTVNVTLASSTSAALGLSGTDISTQADATAAANILTTAITTNSAQQANVGAQESRFNYVIANLTTSIQNTQAASSNYLSTDVSAASTEYASDQVLEEAGISVLAQLNQLPQNLLKLLG